MSSIATAQTLDAAARAAIDSGDWTTAIEKLLQLQTALAAMPNVARNAGGGQESFTFNASNIPAVIANCRRQAARAAVAASSNGPWQVSTVKYVRPTS